MHYTLKANKKKQKQNLNKRNTFYSSSTKTIALNYEPFSVHKVHLLVYMRNLLLTQ